MRSIFLAQLLMVTSICLAFEVYPTLKSNPYQSLHGPVETAFYQMATIDKNGKQIGPLKPIESFHYDQLGRLTYQHSYTVGQGGNGESGAFYVYRGDKLDFVSYSNGETRTNEYDEMGRVVKIDHSPYGNKNRHTDQPSQTELISYALDGTVTFETIVNGKTASKMSEKDDGKGNVSYYYPTGPFAGKSIGSRMSDGTEIWETRDKDDNVLTSIKIVGKGQAEKNKVQVRQCNKFGQIVRFDDGEEAYTCSYKYDSHNNWTTRVTRLKSSQYPSNIVIAKITYYGSD